MGHDHDHDHGHDAAGDVDRFLKVKAVARTLAVDRFTAEAVAALDGAGVPSILLKGPAIARWLYDDASIRSYADCDLLVSAGDVGRAEGTLREIGYEPGPLDSIVDDWERHARTWMRPDSANLDLHRTISGAGADAVVVWRVLSARTETMTVAGHDVTVLDPAARALVVALHAAKDGPRVPKVRHDLGHALDRLPDEVWADAAELAARLDALPAFAAALRTTERGTTLADTLALPADATVLVALREHGAPAMAVGLQWLLEERSVRRRAYVVARKAFPPASYLRASSALARRGGVGLAVAYGARPFVMLARAPRAVSAVRRARSRAGQTPPPSARRD